MTGKAFWKSKVLWFNVLAGALVVAGMLGYAEFAPDADVLALVVAVANLVLRLFTQQPVGLRDA